MIRLELHERGPRVTVPLTAAQGRMLAASGVVSAVPAGDGTWFVGPGSKVGAVRIGDVEVSISPKVEIARLLFLLGYSLHQTSWRDDLVSVDSAAGLVPVVAQILWRLVSSAIRQGLLPGYVAVSGSSTVLRGRLRESAQLHMHHGLPLPLEVRYDEFTVDIAENQILRTACERMLVVPRVDVESARMLRRVLRDFGDVGTIGRGEPVPLWVATRLNARYHTALRLAELVLRATSPEHGAGTVAITGFLLNMEQLFEDFVTVALREALEARFGGRVLGQMRHYLDEAGQVPLKPDIVWQVGGSAAAVVDAKYKAGKVPNADLYQLLAYCTVLGLRVGHLVYAAGELTPAEHVVRQAGITIFCHAVDLSQDSDALIEQVRGLAAMIASQTAIG